MTSSYDYNYIFIFDPIRRIIIKPRHVNKTYDIIYIFLKKIKFEPFDDEFFHIIFKVTRCNCATPIFT